MMRTSNHWSTQFFLAASAMFTIATVAPAQYDYSLNYQTNTIDAVVSNWVGNGTYVVGSNTFLNALIIQNGGVLSNGPGYIGFTVTATNNSAFVTGTGSVWNNSGSLTVGKDGGGNTLTITNGGSVYNSVGFVGLTDSSRNNNVLVSGTGSVWSNKFELWIGNGGAGNTLTITNGGQVLDDLGFLGSAPSGSNNAVLITGAGSVWSNRFGLVVGESGPGNKLTIANGGRLFDNSGTIGRSSSSSNIVVVSGIGSVWTNSGTLTVGAGGIGNQLIITNGGQVFNSGFSRIGRFASNHTVMVTGVGSEWNTGTLEVGQGGAGNRLMIADGGRVAGLAGHIGDFIGDNSNVVVVTGVSSVWSNTGTGLFPTLKIGSGNWNQLIVTNGAQVFNGSANIGSGNGIDPSGSNIVVVTGVGSVWSNTGTLNVGHTGYGNLLVITGGGKVFSSNMRVGASITATNSMVVVTGSGSVLTNTGTLTVGFYAPSNTLLIADGARADSFVGIIGDSNNIANANSVIIAGTNSQWNVGILQIGKLGSYNQLIVTNAATVRATGTLSIGSEPFQQSNSVELVDGGQLLIGTAVVGATNDTSAVFAVAGGISVLFSNLFAANFSGSTGIVTVTQDGEIVVTNGTTVVGASGVGVLIVSNVTAQAGVDAKPGGGPIIQGHGGGGGVLRQLFLGRDDGSEGSALFDGGNNIVQDSVVIGNCPTATGTLTVSNGGLHVTNSTGTAFIDVRSGTVTVSGGTLVADKLIMTNTCGVFVRTAGSVTIPNLDLLPSLDADRDTLPNGWEHQFGLDPIDARGGNGAAGDPDGDGMTNEQEFPAGTNPTDSGSAFRILSVVNDGSDVCVTWTTVGGKSYVVQTNSPAAGSFTSTFTDLSDVIFMPSGGESTTNYVHFGAATNTPALFYRVRLAP